MKADIRVCSAWQDEHDRPRYTLASNCPDCGAAAVNTAPAPFSPEDPNGEYRRRMRSRSDE